MKRISKKIWSNASAFIQTDENGNCSVYGKFYDGCRSFEGPETGILKTLSPELLQEALELTYSSTPSPELNAALKEIWTLAKGQEPWFSYDI